MNLPRAFSILNHSLARHAHSVVFSLLYVFLAEPKNNQRAENVGEESKKQQPKESNQLLPTQNILSVLLEFCLSASS